MAVDRRLSRDAGPAHPGRPAYWGRWGEDDQKGTLNLITPERRLSAARLVREGVSVSLAHDTLEERAEWLAAQSDRYFLRRCARASDG